MWVLSANSTSRTQLAPSCLIDPDGHIIAECKADEEGILTGFGRKGRIRLSRLLNGMAGGD
jgi:predicted amidohydrolase